MLDRRRGVKRLPLAVALAVSGCAGHLDADDYDPDAPAVAPPPVAVVPTQAHAPTPAPSPEPTTTKSTPEAASTCIADVVADAQSAWASEAEHPDDARATIEAELSDGLGDLDGDGRPEIVVVNEPMCGVTGNCPMRMYLSADGCSALALDTFAAYVWPAQTRSHGARTIESWAKDGCAGMAGGWASHRFDGNRYVVAQTVSCGCPDGEAFGWPKETARAPQCPG